MAKLQHVNVAVPMYFTGSSKEETSERNRQTHVTLSIHRPSVK